ncbi:uncharacterized protein LOC135360126 [Latimeria chalumnae]|uniref:uncharacterized protein LOC135360126 n=1 Tax=Latimeria chalumnae TaxID=7897 RepID=UPI00313E0333
MAEEELANLWINDKDGNEKESKPEEQVLGSVVDQNNEQEFFDFQNTEVHLSEQLRTEKKQTCKEYLDSIFFFVPTYLIKWKLLFEKPKCPDRRPPSKYPELILRNTAHLHYSGQEALQQVSEQQKEWGFRQQGCNSAVVTKRFLRTGGMLALPVPVPGPLFYQELEN